jgi:hypothetical protein
MNIFLKNKNIVSGIAILMLLLVIPSDLWPYSYYQVLRWVVTGTALFIAYIAYHLEKEVWIWIMAIVAILFNPITPIYFSKETWASIDLITSITFLISIFRIRINEKR